MRRKILYTFVHLMLDNAHEYNNINLFNEHSSYYKHIHINNKSFYLPYILQLPMYIIIMYVCSCVMKRF